MLSRVSILSFVVTLSILLFGECRADNLNTKTMSLPESAVEVTIVDADIPNPTSLLSGRTTSRVVNSGARSVQRILGKHRTCYTLFAVKAESAISLAGYSQNRIQSTILGGVVADKAFYSLCCLRI